MATFEIADKDITGLPPVGSPDTPEPEPGREDGQDVKGRRRRKSKEEIEAEADTARQAFMEGLQIPPALLEAAWDAIYNIMTRFSGKRINFALTPFERQIHVDATMPVIRRHGADLLMTWFRDFPEMAALVLVVVATMTTKVLTHEPTAEPSQELPNNDPGTVGVRENQIVPVAP